MIYFTKIVNGCCDNDLAKCYYQIENIYLEYTYTHEYQEITTLSFVATQLYCLIIVVFSLTSILHPSSS